MIDGRNAEPTWPGPAARATGSPLSANALAGPQREPLEWAGDFPDSIQVDRRIFLWGMPGSGKTGFLDALYAAVFRAERRWTLGGLNKASAGYLAQATDRIHDRRFPPANGETGHVRWLLSTEVEVRRRRLGREETSRIPLRFRITFIDPPGEFFSPRVQGRRDGLVDDLMKCDGIIYFHDYEGRRHFQLAGDHVHHVLSALHDRWVREGRALDGGRLPHRLAACVSRFDEPEILEAAMRGGHVVEDLQYPHGSPRVADDRAEAFFEEICREDPTGNDQLIRDDILRYFRRDRTRYFATSYIGFYVDRMMRFSINDCYNVSRESSDGIFRGLRVRGEFYPINVLEPLLWLQEPVPFPADSGT